MNLSDLQADVHRWQQSKRLSTLTAELRTLRMDVEIGELHAAVLAWVLSPTTDNHDHIAQEIADVIICAVGLADVLDIDVAESVALKLLNVFERYPLGQPVSDGIS